MNAADPGHTATDINGQLGDRPPSEAAKISVQLALLPDDGPTGTFVGQDGPRAWRYLPGRSATPWRSDTGDAIGTELNDAISGYFAVSPFVQC